MSTNASDKIDFEQVKQAMPLDTFFQEVLGLAPKKVGAGLRFGGCPKCGNSKNAGSVRCHVKGDKWTCYSCNNFGDVIDAAQHHYGLRPFEAAKVLLDGISSLHTNVKNVRLKSDPHLHAPTPEKKCTDKEVKEVIARLLEAQKDFELLDEKVIEYLTKERGISLDVLKEAHKQNLLIILPYNPSAAKTYLINTVGQELLQAAGMWKENAKAPSIVYRPLGLVMCGRTVEFRRIREASSENDAKYVSFGPMSPFFFKGTSEDEYVVVEGGIDLLSIPSLKDYTGSSVIGLPGAGRYDPKWFHRMEGKGVLFALDPDKAGLMALYGNQEIKPELRRPGLIEVVTSVGAEHLVFDFPKAYCSETPLEDRDINDYLQWTQRASS